MADVNLKSKNPYEYVHVIAGLISDNSLCSNGQQLPNETVRSSISMEIKALRLRSFQIDKEVAVLAASRTPADRVMQKDSEEDKLGIVQKLKELTHFLDTVFRSAATKEIYDRILFGSGSQPITPIKAYEAVMHHIKTMTQNQGVQSENVPTSSPEESIQQPSKPSPSTLPPNEFSQDEAAETTTTADPHLIQNSRITEPRIPPMGLSMLSPTPPAIINAATPSSTMKVNIFGPGVKLSHDLFKNITGSVQQTKMKQISSKTLLVNPFQSRQGSNSNASSSVKSLGQSRMPPSDPVDRQEVPNENVNPSGKSVHIASLTEDDDNENSRPLSGYDSDIIPSLTSTGIVIERNNTDHPSPQVSGAEETIVKKKRCNRGSHYVDTTNIVTSKRRRNTTNHHQEPSAHAPTTPPARKRKPPKRTAVTSADAVKSSQSAVKAKKPRKKSNYPRFYCTYCKRSFFRSFKSRHSVSKMHIRNVTKEKRVDVIEVLKTRDKCELCEKVFPIPSEYKAHFELCKKLDSKERVKQKVNLLQLAEQLQKEDDPEKAGTIKELKSRVKRSRNPK